MFESVVLSYGIALFFLTWYKPLPYGKFAIESTEWFLPNQLFIPMSNIFALVFLIAYPQAVDKWPLSGRRLYVYWFLILHYAFRTVVVPFIQRMLYCDTKVFNPLILVITCSYNTFVGISFAHMCTELTPEETWTDIPLLVGAAACLISNMYYDIYVNYLREGTYLPEETLEKTFPLLFACGFTSPNYFFEIMEWSLILLLTWHTESMAYLISTSLILWTRGLHTSLWMLCRNDTE